MSASHEEPESTTDRTIASACDCADSTTFGAETPKVTSQDSSASRKRTWTDQERDSQSATPDPDSAEPQCTSDCDTPNKRLCHQQPTLHLPDSNTTHNLHSPFNFDSQMLPDIFRHWLRKENKLRVSAQAYEVQPTFTTSVRANAACTLIGLCSTLHLWDDTIHLAQQIIDRVAATHQVKRHSVMTLVATALHIAAKFTQSASTCPSVHQYAQALRFPIQPQHVVQLEVQVLGLLGYELGFATAHTLALTWLKMCHQSHSTQTTTTTTTTTTTDDPLTSMTKLVLDVCLLNTDLLAFRPSAVAAAALAAAGKYLGLQMVWEPNLQGLEAGQSRATLPSLIDHVMRQSLHTPRFSSVRNKHAAMASRALLQLQAHQ